MNRHHGAKRKFSPVSRLRRSVVGCLLASCLMVAPQLARADDGGDEAPKPPPRVGIEIGGLQVVLISADDKLYAFVDRQADNMPAVDAELDIATADGSQLELTKAGEGWFVAPFNRTGHMQDAFMVSVRTRDGASEHPAELAYNDLPTSSADAGHRNLPVALAASGLGVALMTALAVCMRSWRRHRARAGAAA
jgi:hypothetical protein